MASPAAPTTMEGRANAFVVQFLDDSAAAIHRRLGQVGGVAVSTAEASVPRTLGASTSLAGDVDQIQFAVGTGPCLHALRTGEMLYVPDLGGDPRWGDYGPRAAARGAACCLSVPIVLDGRPVAVFKVYSAEVDGLTDDQRATAELVSRELRGSFGLARQLATQAVELDDMTALLTHRRVIDLALGILMERAQVPADAAFALLRSQSQQRNVKAHEVAQDVVASIPGTSSQDLVPHFSPRDVPTGAS